VDVFLVRLETSWERARNVNYGRPCTCHVVSLSVIYFCQLMILILKSWLKAKILSSSPNYNFKLVFAPEFFRPALQQRNINISKLKKIQVQGRVPVVEKHCSKITYAIKSDFVQDTIYRFK
jgi:hypothetical protein